MLKQLPY